MPADLFNIAALLQSLATIAFGGALAYYTTRYWKTWDARKKSQDDAAAKLQARNEAADAERQQLRGDHSRLQTDLEAVQTIIRLLEKRMQLMEVAFSHNQGATETTKDTLARIDGQLSMLINTFITRS